MRHVANEGEAWRVVRKCQLRKRGKRRSPRREKGKGQRRRPEWLPALPQNPRTNPEILHTHACFTDRWTANLTLPVHAINKHETKKDKRLKPSKPGTAMRSHEHNAKQYDGHLKMEAWSLVLRVQQDK